MAERLLGLLLLLALCGCGAEQPAVVAATPLASRPAAATATPVPAEIRVYVAGAVARPGVYSLGPDSRVEDAVAAAGGFLPGADMVRVNLAARVHDEEEIFVPAIGEPAPSPAAKMVNVNTAS